VIDLGSEGVADRKRLRMRRRSANGEDDIQALSFQDGGDRAREIIRLPKEFIRLRFLSGAASSITTVHAAQAHRRQIENIEINENRFPNFPNTKHAFNIPSAVSLLRLRTILDHNHNPTRCFIDRHERRVVDETRARSSDARPDDIAVLNASSLMMSVLLVNRSSRFPRWSRNVYITSRRLKTETFR
jgi:hypothetical protein